MQSADRTGTRLAATAILLRDGESGLETLMMKRPTNGSFADAWVWPGGAVERQDQELGIAPNEAEGAAALAAAVRETWEETGLRPDPDSFLAHAIWSPPQEISPRFRTWFFMGPNPGGEPVPHEAEVVELDWVSPAAMLEAHAREEIILAPPTWVTLFQISGSKSAAEALERCAAEPFEHFETRVREDGKLFCWFGDSEFEDEGGTGTGRHRLEAATRPWRYISEPGPRTS